MSGARLAARALTEHLLIQAPRCAPLVRTLRRAVLASAPEASEAIKFHVLCYFHGDSYFKSIGGNICMIETKRDSVFLSFIHGSLLPDPAGLLFGKGKCKRFVSIPDAATAGSPKVGALIRAAARLRAWD